MKGLFWHPSRAETEFRFSPISSVLLNTRITHPSVKVWYLFNFYRCYGNKQWLLNMLKTDELHFWTKFEAYQSCFVCAAWRP